MYAYIHIHIHTFIYISIYIHVYSVDLLHCVGFLVCFLVNISESHLEFDAVLINNLDVCFQASFCWLLLGWVWGI